jgi:hypothetical protein
MRLIAFVFVLLVILADRFPTLRSVAQAPVVPKAEEIFSGLFQLTPVFLPKSSAAKRLMGTTESDTLSSIRPIARKLSQPIAAKMVTIGADQ